MTLIVHCAKRLTTCTYLVSIITQQSIIFIHFKDRYLLYWTSGIWTQICRAWKPSSFQLGTQIPGKEFLTFSKDWGYWSAVSFPSQMWTDAKQGGSHAFFFLFFWNTSWVGRSGLARTQSHLLFSDCPSRSKLMKGKGFPLQPDIKGSGQGLPGPGCC